MQLLKSNNTLVKENNELLKKMHRSAVIAFWFRLLWILVFLGIPFILYFYLIKPYLGGATGTVDSLMEQFEQTKDNLLRLQQYTEDYKTRQAMPHGEQTPTPAQ